MALADAARLGSVATNVVDRTRPPKAVRRRVRAFTLDEVRSLFSAADRTRFGPLVRFLATTGLRRGEALELRWTDITRDGTLTVRRIVVENGTTPYIQDDAKTQAGLRSFDLPAAAQDALARQRKLQLEDKRHALASGKPY